MSLNLLPIVSAEAEIKREHYQTTVRSENHVLIADEPADVMGTDTGMNPYSLLLASLGSCTAITLRMYIDRKLWAVDSILVKLDLYKTETGTLINRQITFTGDINEEQYNRLLTIANACPIHKILTGSIEVKTIWNKKTAWMAVFWISLRYTFYFLFNYSLQLEAYSTWYIKSSSFLKVPALKRIFRPQFSQYIS